MGSIRRAFNLAPRGRLGAAYCALGLAQHRSC